MRPFDRPTQGDSADQIDFDARRRDYLERVVVRALIRSAPFDRWNASEKERHPVQQPGSDPPELVSRFDAGYMTLCDAVHVVGIRELDPGLDAIREGLRQMTPDERTAQLRTWLATDNRVSAVARALLARARPERTDDLFGWTRTGIDRPTYWAPSITSVHMQYLLETADFGANEMLRILYLLAEVPDQLRDIARYWRDPTAFGRDPNFSEDGEEVLRAAFTTFKYWFDDPFRCSEYQGRAKAIREKADKEAEKINSTPEKMDPGSDMTYWSENHRLLFAAAEYLAGQWWPDDLFVSARDHRKEGPLGPPRVGDRVGSEHRDRARVRVLRWLNERLRIGFAEWNAPGYYVEDLLPLLNLVDFAGDEEVSERAAMVLDLLVLDLAVNQNGGAFAGSAGRAYFEHKNCVWGQTVRDSSEVLFGNLSHYVEMNNAAIFLATSPRYQPPDALIALGRKPPGRFTNYSRVSIAFEEAGDYGVGFSTPEDMEFWWSRAAYATKQTILGSHRVAAESGLLDTPPFSLIIPLITNAAKALNTAEDVAGGIEGGIAGAVAGFAIGGPVGAAAGAAFGGYEGASIPDFNEVDAADMASVITEGSVLTRANLYSHRVGDTALASVQNFRPGQLNFQSWPCVATLSNGAMVWTSYPSAGSHIGLTFGTSTWGVLGAILGGPIGLSVGLTAIPDVKVLDETLFKPEFHDGPNWWTGNVVQPRVVQRKGAAITAYEAKEIQKMLFGERTHAWFPKEQFDHVLGPHEARCNVDSARWFFGCAGDSYVGLLSARETDWTNKDPWKDKEIRAEGPTNVFITQVGTASEFGSFERFVTKVTKARVRISGLHGSGELQCSYDIPGGECLELHYDGESRYGGEPLSEDEFPRVLNPVTRIAWNQDRYVMQYDGKSVVHDVVTGRRTLGGQLGSLEHETPLTFYAQNMAMLPPALYKGVDRDRALDHLIDVLRARRPDVVGLSEMWTGAVRHRVCKELADLYPFFVEGPHDPLLKTPVGDVELMGGGLLLLSRHRIVASASTVYRQCSGDDCLANKGAVHARVQPRGHPCPVDVFLTHTQAASPEIGGTTAGARNAVEAQIRHLAAFIGACRDNVVPAILFGDFNADWFAHRDLYDLLVATLGSPIDLTPTVDLEGRGRPTGTSESDADTISSFHASHPARDIDDEKRFGPSTERLDYILSFAGLLFSHHVRSRRIVLEQWTPGRDMSDHYGVEGRIDMTTQSIPEECPMDQIGIRLLRFHCLQPTGGLGDDEVAFFLTVRPDFGDKQTVSTLEIEDVNEGVTHVLDLTPIVLRDPQEELDIIVEGREVDTLSADDSLGRSTRTFRRDELLAMAAKGPTIIGMPMLRGEGSEYVVDIEVTVNVHADGGRKVAIPVS